jgi:hypothetical protein
MSDNEAPDNEAPDDEAPGDDRSLGGPFRPATVATVPSHAEADLIVGLLQANGIYASTSADDAGGAYPGLGFGWVRVLVDVHDVDEAQVVLDSTPGGAPA